MCVAIFFLEVMECIKYILLLLVILNVSTAQYANCTIGFLPVLTASGNGLAPMMSVVSDGYATMILPMHPLAATSTFTVMRRYDAKTLVSTLNVTIAALRAKAWNIQAGYAYMGTYAATAYAIKYTYPAMVQQIKVAIVGASFISMVSVSGQYVYYGTKGTAPIITKHDLSLTRVAYTSFLDSDSGIAYSCNNGTYAFVYVVTNIKNTTDRVVLVRLSDMKQIASVRLPYEQLGTNVSDCAYVSDDVWLLLVYRSTEAASSGTVNGAFYFDGNMNLMDTNGLTGCTLLGGIAVGGIAQESLITAFCGPCQSCGPLNETYTIIMMCFTFSSGQMEINTVFPKYEWTSSDFSATAITPSPVFANGGYTVGLTGTGLSGPSQLLRFELTEETAVPTVKPTIIPTKRPTATPTKIPTKSPPTIIPTIVPTVIPTTIPTAIPTTIPTFIPTYGPTLVPTFVPTLVPATAVPTLVPTDVPTNEPTEVPTYVPTSVPTEVPTELPTLEPTIVPTKVPTITPTKVPTKVPTTKVPTKVPTKIPTRVPTFVPTAVPTCDPFLSQDICGLVMCSCCQNSITCDAWSCAGCYFSAGVCVTGTGSGCTPVLTAEPTGEPTQVPTYLPTALPTPEPTAIPTTEPTAEPTSIPTFEPTPFPLFAPLDTYTTVKVSEDTPYSMAGMILAGAGVLLLIVIVVIMRYKLKNRVPY